MKRSILVIFLMVLLSSNFNMSAQIVKNESPFHLGVDLQTKYVWRGMEMMTLDSSPVIFPQLNYQHNGVYAYVMGGYSINGKYAEVDLGVSYYYKWLTAGISGYYYPAITTAQDHYFVFSNADTGHWWEGYATIAPEKIPVYLTLSTFFAGADKNANGGQAYSSYIEVGSYYDFITSNRLSLSIGASLNESCYNGYEHGFGICNIEGKYTYNVSISNGFSFPLSVSYILNPVNEKAHVNFMMSLAF